MPWAMRWRGSQFQTPTSQDHVEEEEGSEQEEEWTAKDWASVGEDKARGCRGCGHLRSRMNNQCDDGEGRDGVAEAGPVPLERFAEMKGVVSPPSPKKRLSRLRAVARWSRVTELTSAFAPVTTMPPPTPRRNNRMTMLRKPPERGKAREQSQ